MNHYFFSFDVDTDLRPKTDYRQVEAGLCSLEASGYTIYKVSIDTSYIITHEDNKYGHLKSFVFSLLQATDRRIFLRIAKRDGKPLTTDVGVPLCRN